MSKYKIMNGFRLHVRVYRPYGNGSGWSVQDYWYSWQFHIDTDWPQRSTL